jgi:hypothetical protein
MDSLSHTHKTVKLRRAFFQNDGRPLFSWPLIDTRSAGSENSRKMPNRRASFWRPSSFGVFESAIACSWLMIRTSAFEFGKDVDFI